MNAGQTQQLIAMTKVFDDFTKGLGDEDVISVSFSSHSTTKIHLTEDAFLQSFDCFEGFMQVNYVRLLVVVDGIEIFTLADLPEGAMKIERSKI